MDKKQNNKHTLLPFSVIEAATTGVNVNIKMPKKGKIKMYIFQELFLTGRFHKGLFIFQTV